MENIEGYKTIIVAVLALVASGLGLLGVEFAPDEQAAVATGIMALIMLVMRFVTKTPVGGS